ncbi:isoprenoid biosynthesis glyoxalase ElbB, partial [Vibrio chagasii]|uniref:isoprenoid biosynthesis glyoxalase ElbB n=1 Tax=Vibrio chagasii TaxID=170679 RepID=UPI00228346DC
MSKFAVILSGSGVFDGTEINEAVLTLLSLEENGMQYQCFAPDIEQNHVINHLNGDVVLGSRNVLEESARIVRGNVKPISECDTAFFDGVIVIGGFGVAKNLSSFALKGRDFSMNSDVLSVCSGFKEQYKPAGYMCIAPV